jgi:hypothetical protein
MNLGQCASFLALSGALFIASPAAAQDKSFETRSDARDSASYEVKFVDDPLDARPARSYIARIHGATRRGRVLLLRPRTSFVNEMLGSVQAL